MRQNLIITVELSFFYATEAIQPRISVDSIVSECLFNIRKTKKI